MPRHSLDPVALVLGLAFVGLGVAGLGTWIDLRHADGDWITPVGLVLLGLVVVASLLSRTGPPPAPDPIADPEPEAGAGDTPGDRDW